MAGKGEFYIGKRISYDSALCTVRYHGTLAGTKGIWLGIEWDDETRGKHDGTHQGLRVFSCLSNSQTAASFVRPSRPADDARTFLEALRFKYGGEDKAEDAETEVEISGKTVEKVGFDKIRRQQAELRDLRIAVLDELQLCGIGRGSLTPDVLRSAQNAIAQTCPNIVELDLGWSLLENWQDVSDICRPLKRLSILKVSGVRLHSFSIDATDASGQPFAGVEEVQLNETLLRPIQLAEMLNDHFPQLKILSLTQNELDSVIPSKGSRKLLLPTVTSLILDRNEFRDLSSLASMSDAFPNLKDLSLQQNLIDKIGETNAVDTSKPSLFSNLQSLNLSGNNIKDFHFIDMLSLLLPNLASLRISNNPLYTNATLPSSTLTSPSDVPYSFTVARLPSLKMLNYTNITTRDREEGEIYYIAAAGKEIIAFIEATEGTGDIATRIQQARARHPRYEVLCKEYDRDSVFEQYDGNAAKSLSQSQNKRSAPGSLAMRLIEVKFHVSGTTKIFLHRSIARTIDVYRVKSLISREIRLRPLQFRLVYESEELDPVRDGFEQKSSDWDAWGDWDVDGDTEKDSKSQAEYEAARHNSWSNGVLLKDGKKWKKREVEVLDGTKAFGDYIGDDELRTVTIRVEPYGLY